MVLEPKQVRPANQQLVLLVPGLAGPDSDPPVTDYLSPRPASLDRLLSRSQSTSTGYIGLDATLCRCFGIDNNRGPLPVAPLTCQVDMRQTAPAYILRADPVHLRADQRVLRLFDASTFNISQHEADQLAATFNRFYAEQGLRLHVPCPQRWYIELPQAPAISTTALSLVAGQDIDSYLPEGKDAAYWHQLLNEIQMLFHEHEVNHQREQRGEPAINSLWFWGGGDVTDTSASDVARIVTDDALGLGLAHQFSTPRMDVPDSMDELLPLSEKGVTLVVNDALASATQYGDVDRWLVVLRELEQYYFKPLLESMQQGLLTNLAIDPCNGTRFNLNRKRLKYFWKRDQAFERLCRHG